VIRLYAFLLALSAAPPQTPVTAITFSPDGHQLISGSYRELLVWDTATFKLVRRIGPLPGNTRALAFRPNSRTLAVASGVPGRSGAVSLIDFETGVITPLATSTDEILALAFNRDGTLLAAAGAAGSPRVWNPDTQTLIATLPDPKSWTTALAFTNDGKLLATAGSAQPVILWETTTWKEHLRLSQPSPAPIHAIAMSQEGDLLAYASAGTEEHAVRIWRTQNAFVQIDSTRPGQRNALVQTRAFETGACTPLALAFTTARRIAVACSDQTVRIMGPNGNVFATLTGHADWVYTVTASSDGHIASGSADGAIKLWGPAGRLLATLSPDEGATK